MKTDHTVNQALPTETGTTVVGFRISRVPPPDSTITADLQFWSSDSPSHRYCQLAFSVVHIVLAQIWGNSGFDVREVLGRLFGGEA